MPKWWKFIATPFVRLWEWIARTRIAKLLFPGARPKLWVSKTSITPGAEVTASLTNAPGGNGDWLGLFSTSAADDSYLNYILVGVGVTQKTWTVTMPTVVGDYEFRFFLGPPGATRVTTSPTVKVV